VKDGKEKRGNKVFVRRIVEKKRREKRRKER
jgi:hypothetical protein